MRQNKVDSYRFWKRAVLLFVAAAMCWFWYSGMMLQHVWDSPFQYRGADPAYWLLSASGLPSLILYSEWTAWGFSVALIGLLLLAALFAEQRGFAIAAGLLLLLYQLLFNYKIGYHTHHLYGFQFAMLPFYFKPEMFSVSASFARIMACLTYFFAGFFKLIGGGWLHIDSFSNTLQNQHAASLYFYPDALRSKLVFFMIQHTTLSGIVFISAMLLQLSFAAGLFSRRIDRWLVFFILTFHAMDWFLMNLGVFMGMTVMVYLFIQEETGKKETSIF